MYTTEDLLIVREDLQGDYFANYVEIEKKLESKSGGKFFFRETYFEGLQFIRCSYSLRQKELLRVKIENEALEMHFRLNGFSHIRTANRASEVYKGNNFLTYSRDNIQEIEMYPNEKGSFYEIRIGASRFERFMKEFLDTSFVQPVEHRPLLTTPEMFSILAQMENTSYLGSMKTLFYEAKMNELFLLQLQQMKKISLGTSFSYKQKDKDKIYEAKNRIEKYFYDFKSISHLAQSIGMNQRKLMQGFKELFGTTIYTYIFNLKMQESKRMLLEENNYVNEVAAYMGYKNPQHFIAAFKKKFGFTPGKLKR